MDETKEPQNRGMAAQLRRPHGENAAEVGAIMNESNAILNRRTIAMIKSGSNGSILEVGMGNGYFVPEILERFPDCVYLGCDFSEEMIRDASERNQSLIAEKKVSFVFAEAHQLPVDSASVDVVLTINTLYFWNDPLEVLREFKRVLKPGGQLLIGIRPKSIMKNFPFVQYGFTLYSKEALITVLEDSGFKIASVLEQEEPDLEIDGNTIYMESLVADAFLE
jgi:ubiquinone/menaquinone biosynthesis C-methylase UbiE